VGVWMLADVLRMRWAYATGQWTLPGRQAGVEPRRGVVAAPAHAHQ